MKLSEDHIEIVRKDFASMQAKEDFLKLLNFVKKNEYGEKCVPFEMRHLNYHINPKHNIRRYNQFRVFKKDGGERTICAPCSGLKAIQTCLNVVFQSLYISHKNAYGFILDKSIVGNAKKHIGNIYVYNIDLKDFFPSIDQARIWGRLQHPPFNLNAENDRIKIANMIASLCCHEMEVERMNESGNWEVVTKRVLPQGAPTSPVLTNIICERLDYLLTAVAKRFGLKYSRYADDITFSSMHNVYQKDGEFIEELERIVREQGFFIKQS
ncbi:MAG: reverse transcriptase family protein, partial [Prevotellaceae bacterium]|nr:reverse transcriptase family protein [Prevotellaceae bacterium]